MDATEQVKVVAAALGVMKETDELMKGKLDLVMVAIEKCKTHIKPKLEAVLVKLESEVEKRIGEKGMKNEVEKFDIVMGSVGGYSSGLVELVEVMDTLLQEVHEPPSHVDLAVGRVVEEGMEVKRLPATLKVNVARLPNERNVKALKVLVTMQIVAEQAKQVFDIVVEFHDTILPDCLNKWF